MAACQPLQGKELRPDDGCDPVLRGPVLLPRQASSAPPAARAAPPEMSLSSSGSGSGSGRSATEARALKIHSEAERRRRERINAHLATLRRMVPDTRQMDKATLLGRVVEQVKILKRKASEATQSAPLQPPEFDEVSIELHTGADKAVYIRASVSCDDRPGLVAGLAQAFRGLRLRTVRADMASLGGRARHVFVLCMEEGCGSAGAGAGAGASLRSLKEAVRQALARVASPETAYGSSPFRFRSKRQQRVLESHCSIMSI